MLFILRQLRRLELHKRSGRYFLYAIGEIVLIVVGIFIALQLNNWNEGRKNRIIEREMLTNLQKEFLGNQELIEETINGLNSRFDELTQLLLLIHDNDQAIKPTKIDDILDSAWVSPNYRPADGVIRSIIEASNLSLISNENLKYLITQWPREIESYSGASFTRQEYVRDTIKPYMEEHYPSGNYTYKSITKNSFGVSRHSANIEFLLSDLKFENQVIGMRGITFRLLRILKEVKDYQTELLEMLEEELTP